MNKAILFVSVAALLAVQACSKSSRTKTTDVVDKGEFANDSTTTINSKNKEFLCDFQWTPGHKRWAYDFEDDKAIVESGSVKASWCLIPYGESTEYEISVEDITKAHYFCRDAKAIYSIANESEITINYENDTYKNLSCAKLNFDISDTSGTIKITAGSVNKSFQDERLYHIVADRDVYSITGHIDFRLVKPVHLSVLWEPILSQSMANSSLIANLDVSKIKKDWEMYMKKVGYYIDDIIILPIAFPNNMEKVSDGALTLPQEQNVLEAGGVQAVEWYNFTIEKYNSIARIFGAPNFEKFKFADYIIATTPGYKIRYDAQKQSYSITPGDTEKNALGQNIQYGTCYIILTPSQNLDILKNIEKAPNSNTFFADYYSKDNKKLGTGIFSLTALRLTEQECNSVSYAVATNDGGNAEAFGISGGYVLSDVDFFKSKNAGRLLAALLYSKILGIEYPIKSNNDGRWLSSYKDDSDVEQPMRYWREEGTSNTPKKDLIEENTDNQPQLLEFSFFIQDFNSRRIK